MSENKDMKAEDNELIPVVTKYACGPPKEPMERHPEFPAASCSPFLHFDGIHLAVFNSNEYDQRKGREAVKAKFGESGCSKVCDHMKSGIMEIFQHAPTPETELYAETVGHSADHRVHRQNEKRNDG